MFIYRELYLDLLALELDSVRSAYPDAVGG